MRPTDTTSKLIRPHCISLGLLCVFVLAPLVGCFGYRFGAQSLYPPQIRTVHVPVFESASLRRGLGEWLTEAVVKEIELTTPMKVVGRDRADSTLEGIIVAETKRVVVETINDDPREIQVAMRVEVRWTNNQGQLLTPANVLPLPEALAEYFGSVALVPEVGQSVASSQQEAIKRLARQIVATMELPW